MADIAMANPVVDIAMPNPMVTVITIVSTRPRASVQTICFACVLMAEVLLTTAFTAVRVVEAFVGNGVLAIFKVAFGCFRLLSYNYNSWLLLLNHHWLHRHHRLLHGLSVLLHWHAHLLLHRIAHGLTGLLHLHIGVIHCLRIR